MKKIASLLILLTIAFSAFTSCKKKKITIDKLMFDENSLPIITNKGDNFFGYLIDGEPNWYQKKNILDSHVKARYNEQEKLMDFFFESGIHAISIYLRSTKPEAGVVYPLKFDLYNPVSSATFYEDGPSTTLPSGAVWGSTYTFYTNNDTPSYIKILYLNWQTRIITGEFELTVREMGKTTNRYLTKGRFDLKF